MDEHERERLLDQLTRGSTSVGKSILEQVTVQGIEVPLREFVFEIRGVDTIPEAERERADRMVTQLKRERLQRRNRLANEAMSLDEGRDLLQSIVGLDRAINALESLDSTGFEEQAHAKWLENQKRWSAFLHRIL